MPWDASGFYTQMSTLGLTIRRYPNGNDPAKITTNKGKYRTCSLCKKTKHVYRFHSKNTLVKDHQGKIKSIRYRLQRMCATCRNEYNVKKYCKNPESFLLRKYQNIKQESSHAKKSRRRCYITLKQFMDTWKKQFNERGLTCPLSGITMTHTWKQGEMLTNISVDRIDNDKDYELGNIQFVCIQANRMKGALSNQELIFWSRNIANEG